MVMEAQSHGEPEEREDQRGERRGDAPVQLQAHRQRLDLLRAQLPALRGELAEGHLLEFLAHPFRVVAVCVEGHGVGGEGDIVERAGMLEVPLIHRALVELQLHLAFVGRALELSPVGDDRPRRPVGLRFVDEDVVELLPVQMVHEDHVGDKVFDEGPGFQVGGRLFHRDRLELPPEREVGFRRDPVVDDQHDDAEDEPDDEHRDDQAKRGDA